MTPRVAYGPALNRMVDTRGAVGGNPCAPHHVATPGAYCACGAMYRQTVAEMKPPK